jgi:hypothetical protein
MENEWKKPIQKPIGVYVCTILIFIRFGLFQFINYFSAIREANGEVLLPIVVVSLGLCVFTAASSIWAFIGDNAGRISLMIFVALNLLWAFFLASLALSDVDIKNDEGAVLYIINLVFTSFFIIAFFVYFMSKKVVEYYKQND